MRIEHLVLSLGLTISLASCMPFLSDETVWNVPDNPDDQASRFVRDRVVPALKVLGVHDIDLTMVRLCYCSTEVGCQARTTGWLPGLYNMSKEEKVLYENTCYTDGYCYQAAHRAPALPMYGCMDQKSFSDETDFEDSAAPTCTNTTGFHASSWICCTGNYCANQTTMYLPPLRTYTGSILSFSTFCFLFFAIALILFVIVENPLKRKLFAYLRKSFWLDSPLTARSLGRSENEQSTSGHFNPVTMSTTPGGNYPDGFPPNVIRMINTLEEESSGSGQGPNVMYELTIGRQIEMLGKIGAGRFGNVSLGIFRGEYVAVKVFQSTDEQAFDKEVSIYETAMLRHPNVLRYIASDRLDRGHLIELWLVTEYHSGGSLHDFLEKNTVSLKNWYNLMRSAASGLSFLHCSIGGHSQNSKKPAIAHRDIKSRNIMVRNDFSCAIGDLGLSLSLAIGKNKPPETNPRCGTVRYLAPEILNNTIQTSIFESYMQADVYAFTLVMWETLCRCAEDNVTAREPDMSIPYVEYTDRDPTDQQMYDVVVERRLRPTEDPEWRKNPEFEYILDLMRMNWNANPTARYTSIQMRMKLEAKHMEMEKIEREAAAAAEAEALALEQAKAQAYAEAQAQLQVKAEAEAQAQTELKTPCPTSPKPTKEIESIQMEPLNSRGSKVYDQEFVKNQNGQFKGTDEAMDPLLG